MSWSVSAIGRVPAVRAAIAKQFADGGKCVEPEESIRQAAAKVLDSVIVAQDPTNVVKVTASGSQSFKDYGTKTGIGNGLTIVVEPIFWFLE
jgi:hypothetical protein